MIALPQTLRIPRVAATVAVSHFALEACASFLPIVYPELRVRLGLSYEQIGFLALLITIAGALTQPLFGYLSDRTNPRWIVAASVAWLALFYGVVGLTNSYRMLAVVLVLAVLASAAFHPAGAALARTGDPAVRGMSLSWFSVAGNLGTALSPVLVGFAMVRMGLRGTLIVIPVGVLAALWAAWALRSDDAATGSAAQTVKPKTAYGRMLPMALLVLLVATRSWVQGAWMTYLPDWSLGAGQSAEAASLLLSLTLIGSGAGSLLGGYVSDRVGNVSVLLGTYALLVPAQWLLLNAGMSAAWLAGPLVGLLIGMSYPAGIVLAQDVWPNALGMASALIIGVAWFPAGLGSWIVGRLADNSDLPTALNSLMILPIVGIALIVWFRYDMKN